jgi:hypothetical protein
MRSFFALPILALTLAPASAADPEAEKSDAAIAAVSAPKSLLGEEEEKLVAAARAASTPEEAARARRDGARFYLERELYVEALAALDAPEISPDDDEARLMVGYAQYALGRYASALETLSDERVSGTKLSKTLQAMALSHLGACVDAARIFESFNPDDRSPAKLKTEFYLLKGECALARDDIVGANAGLARAIGVSTRAAELPDVKLLAASIAVARGGDDAQRLLKTLSEDRDRGIAALAALRSLLADARGGAVDREAALRALTALRFKWSGGAFERELLAAFAALAAKDDPNLSIDALRALVNRHGRSDAAAEARKALAKLLGDVVAMEDLPPQTAAQIFYENIEFAPAGAEGDALIRNLVVRLAKLDLLKEASELLEHQVFKRLRGAEKSRIAADLARIYLDDRRPSEALRVIRATRLAGLDGALVERRRLIEATALERTGASDAALEFLANAKDGPELQLRADIEWRAKAYKRAAISYWKLAETASAPLDEKGRNALLRAGAALLLAGDQDGYKILRDSAAARFGGYPEQELLDMMSLEADDAGEKFLKAYRSLYSAGG